MPSRGASTAAGAEQARARIGLTWHSPRLAPVLATTWVLAFGLCLATRVAFGEATFGANSYSAYYEMAGTFLGRERLRRLHGEPSSHTRLAGQWRATSTR